MGLLVEISLGCSVLVLDTTHRLIPDGVRLAYLAELFDPLVKMTYLIN